jgi:hypothetical protein
MLRFYLMLPTDSADEPKFLPLAKADGMPFTEFKIEDDPMPHKDAVRLMRVKWFDTA